MSSFTFSNYIPMSEDLRATATEQVPMNKYDSHILEHLESTLNDLVS